MTEFNLTPKQAYAYLKLTDKKTKEVGYGGGAGGGKSILGCFWIIEQSLRYPGTAWVIGRRELTNLKKTTLLTFFQTLQLLGLDAPSVLSMNSQTNIINWHNGSRIFLMDMSYQPSDPLYTRFGGLELTGAFVDESNENQLQAIEILKTRMGRCKNKEYKLIPKILETFNPSKNHVYHRYYKAAKDGKLPVYRLFITALATDNPYLDPSYIEQLRNADKITRERLLYGNFDYDDDPSKIFDYEKIIEIFDDNYINKVHEQRYISCDVARYGLDKTVIVIWQGDYIKHIYTMDKSSVKQVIEKVEEFAQREGIPHRNIVIDEDGVGGGVVDMMKNVRGFVNNSSPKESIASKKLHNYRNLKAQCYFKLAEMVNANIIKCYDLPVEIREKIIEDLEQIAQKDIDKDGKITLVPKEEMKENLGRSTDYGDAIMMKMLFELSSGYIPHISC